MVRAELKAGEMLVNSEIVDTLLIVRNKLNP